MTQQATEKAAIPQCAAEVYRIGPDGFHSRCSRKAVSVRHWHVTCRRYFVCRQHSRASFFWRHESAEKDAVSA